MSNASLSLTLTLTLSLVLAVTAPLAAADSIELVVDGTHRDVPVLLRLPDEPAMAPVVLISHGLGGSRHGNQWIGEAWAAHGLVVVHLQHTGSDRSVWEGLAPREAVGALRQAASVQEAVARLNDVTTVLDALEQWQADPAHPAHGRLSLDHIGIAGHSFGAVTTLGMLGQNYGGGLLLNEPRLDAGIALSPQSNGRVSPAQAFGGLTRPLFCLTGSNDTSFINPEVSGASRRQVYEALPDGAAYLAWFNNANHADFGDPSRRASRHQERVHRLALPLTQQFWDAYLRDDAAALSALQQHQAGFQRGDEWLWK